MALSFVWQAWVRLRRRKDGPGPIGWADIASFRQATGTRLDPRDIALIEAVDNSFIETILKQEASPADQQQALRDGLKQLEKPQSPRR